MYIPGPNATPEAEALAAVYRFILFERPEGEAVKTVDDDEKTQEGGSAR
jgi:hypothetical protein